MYRLVFLIHISPLISLLLFVIYLLTAQLNTERGGTQTQAVALAASMVATCYFCIVCYLILQSIYDEKLLWLKLEAEGFLLKPHFFGLLLFDLSEICGNHVPAGKAVPN